jgi:hypothetical protein
VICAPSLGFCFLNWLYNFGISFAKILQKKIGKSKIEKTKMNTAKDNYSTRRKANNIPGYTGFKPAQVEENTAGIEKPGHYIPGYAGFVKGIKSENLYGHTYGQITQQSTEHTYHKGHDLPPEKRFHTSVQDKYTDVMVQRREDFFSFTRLSTDDKSRNKSDLAASFYQDVDYSMKGGQDKAVLSCNYEDLYPTK